MTFPPSQTQQLPQGSSFGLEFNYAVWTAGTQIELCNVPWSMDYRDVVYFDSQAQLDSYLTTGQTPVAAISNMTYARPGVPIRVNLPFNACYQYNYLRVSNPAQPVPGSDSGRVFYYFITDVRYIAPNTTEIQVQLDVWQTFCRDVTLGNCFIERGHIGIANENGFDDNGRTYLTVPEGLDCGNEYVIAQQYEHEIANSFPGTATAATVYGIIVTSTTALKPPYGDITAPVLNTANGSNFEEIPNGCETYFFKTPGAFQNFMITMADKPWITQGIISITAVPQFTTPDMLNDPFVFDSTNPDNGTAYQLNGVKVPEEVINLAPAFRDDVNLGRYALLKKFLTYPYTLIELTTFSGNPLILKPECIPTADLSVNKIMHLAQPSPRIAIYPLYYNSPKGVDTTNHYGGEFLDMVTGIMDLPTFSIVNNGYLGYMASNKNTIAYQHSSADWSQNKAMTSANYDYLQAQSNMSAAGQQTGAGVNAAQASNRLYNETQGWRMAQGMANGAVGAIEGAAMGNPLGIVSGVMRAGNAVADAAINTNNADQQTNINNNLAFKQNSIRQNNMGFIRDTNNEYAQFAAKGDYANAIAAINAKVQDAKMIQPTTSGQMGGDAFNLASYKWGVFARLKTLQPAAMALIGEFWLRYGYSVNRFGRMPSSYQVMDTFTYWKLRETYITSSTCPEGFRQTIRGIFEKGVTVWSNPANIGNVDMASNSPLAGVVL